MRLTLLAIPAFFLLAGCVRHPPPGAIPAPPPGAAMSPLLRTGETVTGQLLPAPPAPFEIVVTRVVLPAGGMLPMHRHPWQRIAYVESGRIRVAYEGGRVVEAGPGEAIVEAVDVWHEGRALGNAPVTIVVIDQVPPGRSNVVPRN